MSTTVKVMLGIIAGIVIACLAMTVGGTALLGWAGVEVAKSISTTPEEAEQMAAEVAEFDLPAGYQPQYGLRAMGISVSAYTNDNPSAHLFIAQAGPDSTLDVEDIERMVHEAQPEQKPQQNKDIKLVRKEEMTVRGKPAMLMVSEGINSENQPYQQMTLLFEGKGGPAVISISAPTAAWDEEAYIDFIQSVH